MALDQSALLELLGELKLTDVTDRIRVATETLYQELIDAEAAAFIGAAPFERTPARVAQRNGTRPRTLTTTAGDLELRIPKLRQGSFFPSLLERRRRVDQALFAVVMEAYVHGVSTRKVDDLVKALGADTGICKSEVSRICANLDEDVAAFRDRPLADTTYPYVFLDATYCKARVGRRVVSQAVVVAVGVAADGRREVLGFEVGDTESQPFWTTFLRSLKARGLDGVKLVISDAHTGLIAAIETVFQGSVWQRCRVHFMRNVLANVPEDRRADGRVDHPHDLRPARHRNTSTPSSTRSSGCSTRSHPKIAEMLEAAQDDLLAFAAFPYPHWRQIWSTNPLERVNKEIKRRTDVVGTFPNPAALLRLAGHVLIEQHDEWDGADRRYFSEHSMKLLNAEHRGGGDPGTDRGIITTAELARCRETGPPPARGVNSKGQVLSGGPFTRWGRDAAGDS